jgi:hypothetical protein
MKIKKKQFLEVVIDSQKTGFYAGFAAGAKNQNVKSLKEIDKLFESSMQKIHEEASQYVSFEEV